MKTTRIIDSFTTSYIECALWCGIHEEDEKRFNKKAEKYSINDIRKSTLNKMILDCTNFSEKYSDLLSMVPENPQWTTDELNGHDFWLSRNGHGSGFFDRDYPDNLGDRLQEAAKSFGEFDIYVGDDGKVYSL